MAVDHGEPVLLRPADMGEPDAAQAFVRLNEAALARLDVRSLVEPAQRGVTLRLQPGARVGAVPLRHPTTGRVFSGFVVRPRFDWAGMGRVLDQTGWQAAPDLLALPLVPGSGREVPPWVIAGPAIRRLRDLLGHLARGHEMAEDVLPRVRGSVRWAAYAATELPSGNWQRFPCRFPELGPDTNLRSEVRWALERLHRLLAGVAAGDRLSAQLAGEALTLLSGLADVIPRRPGRASHLLPEDPVVGAGREALGWVADDRGLGGSAESDGLAWAADLDGLWERFVEGQARAWAATVGGSVATARDRTALVPVRWRRRAAASLRNLAPDVVVRVGRRVVIFDAKYKAHLTGLDAEGWRALAADERDAHRADVHQALAYAALFDAEVVTTALTYPLRAETWRRLADSDRAVIMGDVATGGRAVRLALLGLPFGWDSGHRHHWPGWDALLAA